MTKVCRHIVGLLLVCLQVGCMDFGPSELENFEAAEHGVFICNEGNFMYGNASLSYYAPIAQSVENEIFIRANDMRLGDVAHSMTLYNNTLYIVVNNSGVIFAIAPDTFTLRGILTGVNSPRYIHFVAPDKAYISDLYDSRINIFDPRTMQLTGHIPTPSHPSTECFAATSDRVFVNCWSRDNTILGIDPTSDSICDSIHIEGQPRKMVIDQSERLWVVTDCGVAGNITPKLYRLTTSPLAVEMVINLPNISPTDIGIDATRSTIYILNKHIWALGHTADKLPSTPVVDADGRLLYALGIDPTTSDIYCSDAIDYIQSGVVYRYNHSGTLLDSFTAGIIPGSFCFK